MNNLTVDMAKKMFESLDSVALLDKEGRYVYVTNNWLKNRGEKIEEVIGKFVWEFVPDTKAKLVMETKRPIIGEIIECKAGKAFTSYFPIFENNEFCGIFVCSFIHGLEKLLDLNKKFKLAISELETYKLKLQNTYGTSYNLDDIVGESKAVKSMKEKIMLASRVKSTVLIEGETGTGKELVAHSIHNLSERSKARFIRVNCSAIPPELMESEFFGYEEGAFTGAKKGGKAGKFELANGGSMFLDEVNQLPVTIQPKFLRVLQENEIERLSGKEIISLDVRIIAATNMSLEKLIEDNKFRRDLFYRFNVIKINIPPLRERKDDMELIVNSIVARLNQKMGTTVIHIDKKIIGLFNDYDWPGNIRELQNVLENAMTKVWGDSLDINHFEEFKYKISTLSIANNYINNINSSSLLRDIKNEIEYLTIVKILKSCDGNKVETAKRLGISRNVLYSKLEKYNLL